MNVAPPPRLGRAYGLLVRYWACNMTVVHDQGGGWPGFGYTVDEQAALRALARRVPALEFTLWIACVAVFALLFFAGLGLLGIWLLAKTSADPSLDAVPATTFMLSLGVEMVASVAVGLPAALLVGSVLTGRLFGVVDADLPGAQVCAHYVHKLCFQLLRAAFLGSAVVVAACLWLPDRVWLLTRCVVPVLAPAVGVATALYYRVRVRKADPVAVDSTPGSG